VATVRRLGVNDSAVDDVTQEVFVTVHRRLGDSRDGCAIKTWVLVSDESLQKLRRSRRRKAPRSRSPARSSIPEILADNQLDPHEQASRAQAGSGFCHKLLAELTRKKASVFVSQSLKG